MSSPCPLNPNPKAISTLDVPLCHTLPSISIAIAASSYKRASPGALAPSHAPPPLVVLHNTHLEEKEGEGDSRSANAAGAPPRSPEQRTLPRSATPTLRFFLHYLDLPQSQLATTPLAYLHHPHGELATLLCLPSCIRHGHHHGLPT